MVQGLTDRDFFTVFRNELFSLAPKMIFVWIIVEKLMTGLLFNKKLARFIAIYISLMLAFAFWLRLIDNYIILRYFLTHWTREPLWSIAPFLYNVIKLQFLLTIPFCVKLYRHLAISSNAAQQVAATAGEKEFLYIKCERRMIRLSFDDIYYFEAQGNYLTAFTVTGTFKTYLSISDLEDKLPAAMFTRIHRSFVVALNKVESHTGSLVMIGNRKIPIGRSYIPKIRNSLL
ncbi:MAG: putative regulator of cell autolysis [Mucilaginibacter sp.]|nr:putative regulator of cell autolysis [Mucilaginibacter sp.]